MKTALSAFLLLALSALLCFSASAQSVAGYNTSLGFRGGLAAGISAKHFFWDDAALEAIISSSFRYRGTALTVLYEKHATAFNVEGLNWYYGFGGHVGRYRGRDYFIDNTRRRNRHYNDTVLGIGIDGVVGIEYYIGEIPFTIGVDVKPYVNINGGGGNWDSALILRYVF
jgi:opacity protein-like surface antigen